MEPKTTSKIISLFLAIVLGLLILVAHWQHWGSFSQEELENPELLKMIGIAMVIVCGLINMYIIMKHIIKKLRNS